MKTYRTAAVGIALGAAVLWLFAIWLPARTAGRASFPSTPPADQTRMVASSPSVSLALQSSDSVRKAQARTTERAIGDVDSIDPSSDANAIVRNARTAHDALNQLMPRALAGDGASALAIRSIFNRCLPIENVRPDTPKPIAAADTATQHAQQRLIERLAAYCNDARLSPQSWPLLRSQLDRTMQEGVSRGDESAIAEDFSAYFDRMVVQRGMTGQQEIDFLWQLASAARSPNLTAEALTKLSTIVPEFGVEALGLPSLSVLQKARIHYVATELLRCERGAPCGPNESIYMQQQCLYEQNCAMNLSFPEFARTRALSATDYDAMLRYLAYLRAELAKHRRG